MSKHVVLMCTNILLFYKCFLILHVEGLTEQFLMKT